MATALGALSAGCEITTCDEGAICLENDDSASHHCSLLCRRLADCGRIDDDQRGACIDACEESYDRDSDDVEDYCECASDTTCRNLDRSCGQPPISLPRPDADDDRPGQPAVDAGTSHDASVDASVSVDGGAGYDAGSWQDASFDADAALDASVDASRPGDAGADARVDASHDASQDAGTDAGPRPDAAPGSCTCDEDCAASEGCLNGSCRARCQASCECRLGDVCEQGLCVPPPPASISCQTDCDCPAGDKCVSNVCAAPTSAPPVQ
ncbi:MAG TPA: hypothetical protein VFZ61_03455 [Polyangiales bacterium]